MGSFRWLFILFVSIGSLAHRARSLPISEQNESARPERGMAYVMGMAVTYAAAGIFAAFAGHIVVDFYADWCTACKDFERKVLNQASIQHALKAVEFVSVDLTQADAASTQVQQAFHILGPPAILVFQPGNPSPTQRRIGELNRGQFQDLLVTALQNFPSPSLTIKPS